MSEENATTTRTQPQPTLPPPPPPAAQPSGVPPALPPVTLLRPASLEEQVTEMLGRKPTSEELRQAARLKMEAERIERGEVALLPAGAAPGSPVVPPLEFSRLTREEFLAAQAERAKQRQEYAAFLARMGAWVSFALYGAPQPTGRLTPAELKFVQDTILSIEEARALEPYLILDAQNLYTAMVYGVRIAQEERVQKWETVAILVAASAAVAAGAGGLATWLGPSLGLVSTKSLVTFATWTGFSAAREAAKELTKEGPSRPLSQQEKDARAERWSRDLIVLLIISIGADPEMQAMALTLQLAHAGEEE